MTNEGAVHSLLPAVCKLCPRHQFLHALTGKGFYYYDYKIIKNTTFFFFCLLNLCTKGITSGIEKGKIKPGAGQKCKVLPNPQSLDPQRLDEGWQDGMDACRSCVILRAIPRDLQWWYPHRSWYSPSAGSTLHPQPGPICTAKLPLPPSHQEVVPNFPEGDGSQTPNQQEEQQWSCSSNSSESRLPLPQAGLLFPCKKH